MNRLGSLGYRMKFSATSDLPMSIVASDEGKFEYGWFETKSNLFFAKNRLDQNLDAFAMKGFYLADHIFIGAACEAPYPPDPVPIEKCVYTDCFIVEKGPQVKKTKQIIVSSAPGWKARPSEDLTTAINEKVSEGYYPVRAISKFEIVLEKGVNSDDVIKEKPQFQVVRTGLAGGDIKKKVNELAGQGFRLLLVDNGIAILYRNSGTLSAPASYTWVDARKKNFEKEIAKLEQTGARYCVAYPNAQGVKDSLIFETISKSAIAKEFRILRFEFDFKEDQAANKVNVDLTAASKDVVKQMNALAKEGFVVQDLFQADKISVILERSR
jgi:hypothetical protein